MRNTLLLLITFLYHFNTTAQTTDSTKNITTFSGSIGITNNGFSIVPTFSLNSPATNMLFSWRKNKFSFDPDIRLVPDLSKGGLLFWFRYRFVETPKFTLRAGVHPAFSLIRKTITDNGTSREISEMLRFVAYEIVPNYRITPHWSVGAMYLHGRGLQKYGPQSTHVLFLNTSISNIKLGGDFRFQMIPTVFFLKVDQGTGSYFSGTGILSKNNFPFTLQSTINQTFTSDIAGNQDFMWNVLLAYNFRKSFRNVSVR